MLSTPELERLYDDYSAGLLDYLCAFVRCEAAARDLLHDLFVKLGARGLPDRIASEKAYLWHLAHNLAMDALRRQSRHDRIHERIAADQDALRSFEHCDDPDASDFASQVRGAMDALPPDQRSIAQMKLWDGLTFEEIAQVQGISPNTAASRYRYAIDKLRSQLRSLYEEITL